MASRACALNGMLGAESTVATGNTLHKFGVTSLHPISIRPSTEATPAFKYCPMSLFHANALPPAEGANSVFKFPPGSLVVALGGIGGVALPPSEDSLAGVLQWFALGWHHHLVDVAIAEAFNWVRWWHVRVPKQKPKPKPEAKSKAKGKKKVADAEPEEAPEEAELPKAPLWCACNHVSIAKTVFQLPNPTC